MKKLTFERRLWLIRHTRKAEKRRLKRANAGFFYRSDDGDRQYQDDSIELTPPEIMSLSQNYDDVVHFLHAFRQVAIADHKRVKIDFTSIKELQPGAALVLSAELDRWRKKREINLKPYKFLRWKREIRQLLFEMGFFELLKQSKSYQQYYDPGVWKPLDFIKFITDDNSDGDLAGQLIEAALPLIGPHALNRLSMFAALSEAITNAVQHAYPEDYDYRYDILKRQWWISGSFDKQKRILTLMCYDQGVGIHVTLPKQNIEKLKSMLDMLSARSELTDARMIQAAMEFGRTSTRLTHRGKGLQQVQRLAEIHNGKLRIISGRGEYKWDKLNNVQLHHHIAELGGTFIQWEFDLNPGGSNAN